MKNDTFWTNVKQYGNDILYIGYKDGERVQERFPFKPTLFVESNVAEPSQFKSLFGVPLQPLAFESIKEAKEHLKMYQGVQGYKLYGTDRFANQFLAETFQEKTISYLTSLIRIFSLDIEVYSGNGFPDPQIASEIITAITLHDSKTDKFHVWTIHAYDATGKVWEARKDIDPTIKEDPIKDLRSRIIHHSSDTEQSMLFDFLAFWQQNPPDILTGWNVRFFDLTYIYNRLNKLFGESVANQLSPWRIVSSKKSTIKRFGQTSDEVFYEIAGVSELDLFDLYKKYSDPEESYKLGHIGKVNLGIEKVEYEGSLHQLYTTDYQKYVDYNIQDSNIVVELERKLKLLALIIEVSYMAKAPIYTDSLGTVKYWEIYSYNYLLGESMMAEITSKGGDKDVQYIGAYVKEPQRGMFDYVATFDFEALYITILRQLNIGFETLVNKEELGLVYEAMHRDILSTISVDNFVNKTLDTNILKKYNFSLSANGQLYKRDHISFFSAMLREVVMGRKVDKKLMLVAQKKYEETKDKKYESEAEMYDIKQRAKKTLGNGFYGGVGNPFFQFFNVANAEAITLTGQVFIKSVIKGVNEYLNKVMKTKNIDYVIAGDTDSIFLNLGPLVKSVFENDLSNRDAILNFMDSFCKEKLTPLINNICADLFDYMNHYENLMNMKREKIIERGVWNGQKKRYCLSVYDSEGVRFAKPKIYVTGMQSVSTATPQISRDALEEAFRIILTENEANLQTFVEKFKKEFMASPIEKIAFPRGVNDIEGYTENGTYKAGTPAHTRAAILYNKLLKDKGISQTKEKIESGTKIKWVYLKVQNPLQETVIGFVDKLPKEFGLDKYVDYNLQYEKQFLKPLSELVEVFGWKTEPVNDLSFLFG